jgi:hypothetical protein
MSNRYPWKKFGDDSLTGLCWIRGERPKIDFDIDDNGETVLVKLEWMEEFVSLVEINFDPDDQDATGVFPVDRKDTGGFEDDWVITHYKRVEPPRFTEEVA